MTMIEIVQEMLKDVHKYTVLKEADVLTEVPVRTHKKHRINKKWAKRYGTKIVFKKKMAHVADITVDDVIEFCYEKQLPLPEELLSLGGDING